MERSPVVYHRAMNKLGSLAGVLLRDPKEFLDRTATIFEFEIDRLRNPSTFSCVQPADLIRMLDQHLSQFSSFLNEPACLEMQDRMAKAKDNMDGLHNPGLGRICYAACRALKPSVVVETGVGFGFTSAFILRALEMNDHGALWSIDLPPLGLSGQPGAFVPPELQPRWHLVVGRVRRRLPSLLQDLGAVDLFLHDSAHTYRNMTFEYRTVWPVLRPGGVMISDDVYLNRAFENFISRSDMKFAAVDAARLFGIAIKR